MSKIADASPSSSKPIVEGLGMELVEVLFAKDEGRRRADRIHRQGGRVSLNDCEAVHNAIDAPARRPRSHGRQAVHAQRLVARSRQTVQDGQRLCQTHRLQGGDEPVCAHRRRRQKIRRDSRSLRSAKRSRHARTRRQVRRDRQKRYRNHKRTHRVLGG